MCFVVLLCIQHVHVSHKMSQPTYTYTYTYTYCTNDELVYPKIAIGLCIL